MSRTTQAQPSAAPGLMTVEQVADYLGLSTSYIRKAVHARTIPSLKIGSAVRFRRSDIDAWVDGFAVAVGAR